MIKMYKKFSFMLFNFYLFLILAWCTSSSDWMYLYDALTQVIPTFIQSFDLPWSNFSPISLLQMLRLKLKFGGMCFYGHVFFSVHFEGKWTLKNMLKLKGAFRFYIMQMYMNIWLCHEGSCYFCAWHMQMIKVYFENKIVIYFGLYFKENSFYD